MPPARLRRVIMVALGVLVLAAGGALVRSRLGPSLVSNRVFVAGFINETGDPALDHVGKIVADWLARRLQETRSVEVLDPRTVLASQAAPSEPEGMVRIQTLATSMGAGTLVSGTYYLRGDALEFQAHVTETGTGRLLQALAPVSGPLQDPMQGVEALSQAVMASIATLFSEDLGSLARAVSHPANYTAYREYVAGVERFEQGDPVAAMRRFYGALRTDPTFVAAALWVASVHVQQGQYQIADSITGVLEQSRTRLTDVERHVLDWLRADLVNDHAASYRAGRQAYALVPASVEIGWLTALSAYKAHRLRETVRIQEP